MPQPVATVTTPPDARWAAYADGIGHAYLRGGARGMRSLCADVRRLEERWEHPIATRCDPCTAVLNQVTKDALVPEGEARALWGDR